MPEPRPANTRPQYRRPERRAGQSPFLFLLFILHSLAFEHVGDFSAGPNMRVPATPRWDLVLTQSEWLAPNLIRVPFQLTGALITVQARVDQVEGNFLFDTGANRLLLNHRYFGQTATAARSGAGGVTGIVQVLGAAWPDTFRLDNLVAANISADLIDLSHIEKSKNIDLVGIIGYEMFKDFEVIFDYAASSLLLVRVDSKGEAVEPLPIWEYIPQNSYEIRVNGYIAMLKLQFGEKTRLFGLDSGAEQNLLSTTAGKGFLADNFVLLKRVKLKGAGSRSVEVLAGNLHNSRLDSLSFKPMATLLTNMSELNATYQTNLDGVLGYEFLSQHIVGINYKKRRITFYKEGARP